MKTFAVKYERDEDGWWVASVPEIEGCHTQGRSIAQARERIREAIMVSSDVVDFEIEDHVRLPKATERLVEKLRALRAKLERDEKETAAALKAAVAALDGLSVRDRGEVLGLSHQRINQIMSAQRPRAKKAAVRR